MATETDKWEFAAPQFCDFGEDDDPNADRWFDQRAEEMKQDAENTTAMDLDVEEDVPDCANGFGLPSDAHSRGPSADTTMSGSSASPPSPSADAAKPAKFPEVQAGGYVRSWMAQGKQETKTTQQRKPTRMAITVENVDESVTVKVPSVNTGHKTSRKHQRAAEPKDQAPRKRRKPSKEEVTKAPRSQPMSNRGRSRVPVPTTAGRRRKPKRATKPVPSSARAPSTRTARIPSTARSSRVPSTARTARVPTVGSKPTTARTARVPSVASKPTMSSMNKTHGVQSARTSSKPTHRRRVSNAIAGAVKRKAIVKVKRDPKTNKATPSSMKFSSKCEELAKTTTASYQAKLDARKEAQRRKPALVPGRLTNPVSPKFATAQRERHQQEMHMTSEERELNQVAAMKQAMEKRRHKNAEMVQRVLQKRGSHVPCRSVKDLTQPQEFRFFTAERTRSRSRSRGRDNVAQTPKPRRSGKKSKRGTRTDPVNKQRKQFEITAPVPFNFSTEERIKAYRARRPTVAKEQSPEAVRQILRSEVITTPRGSGLTRPRSPLLRSNSRSRPSKVKSTAEREEEELKLVPKFKARPLRPDVMNSDGSLGVPRIPRAQRTEPKEFMLATDSRASSRASSAATTPRESPDKTSFKARPFNKELFSKAPKLPQGSQRALTKPESPNITKVLKKRKSPESAPAFKARPMPAGSPFRPVLHKKARTEPQPFNLNTEKRGELHQAHLQQRLQQQAVEEQAAREFIARPMHNAAPLEVQPAEVPLTEPQPFKLRGAELSAKRRAEIMEQIEREAEAQRSASSQFRARPVPQNSPFLVKKSSLQPVQPAPFHMHSDVRATERQAFDQDLSLKRQQIEAAKQQEQQQRQAEEALAVKKMRQRMVPKAHAVRKGQPLIIKKSDRPLVEPISPNLQTRVRAVKRSHDFSGEGLENMMDMYETY